MAVIKQNFSSDPEMIRIGDLISVEPSWEIHMQDATSAGGNATISVRYDERLRRFAIDAVHIERAGSGEDVTGAMLREIRFQEAVQRGAPMRIWLTKLGGGWIGSEAVLRTMRPIEGRATDADLPNIALVYAIATISYLPALKETASVFGVSQSTATRLVQRAREAGELRLYGIDSEAPER